jgi:hypothetical protein
MKIIKKFQCPCCGYYTLDNEPPGSFDICPVCFWEDDSIQYTNPDYAGGANDVSLKNARENYKKIGAISEEHVKNVRLPSENEK